MATRLGFYIVHNNRYKMVKAIDVPWNFTAGEPDNDDSTIDGPIIGEWKPQSLIYIVSIDDIIFKDDYQFVIKKFKNVVTENEEEGITKETLYRVTYKGIGIYEALRRTISKEDWENFLNNDKVSWLLIPPFEYKKGYRSFFTAEGYKKFKEETLPIISEYLDESMINTETIEIVEKKPEGEGVVVLSNVAEGSDGEEDTETPEETDEEEKPKIIFEDWVTNYFYNVIFLEKDFFNVFNTNKTYVIIAEEDPSVMGFMITYKGRTIINFEEHDYRNIINAMYPNIRQDMINMLDDSFGGYDDDIGFLQGNNKHNHSFCNFNKNKGIDTYPNLF